jgi:hypothetical protein
MATNEAAMNVRKNVRPGRDERDFMLFGRLKLRVVAGVRSKRRTSHARRLLIRRLPEVAGQGPAMLVSARGQKNTAVE